MVCQASKAKWRFFLQNEWGKTPMSGNDVKTCLDALMTHPSQRDGDPPLGNIRVSHTQDLFTDYTFHSLNRV